MTFLLIPIQFQIRDFGRGPFCLARHKMPEIIGVVKRREPREAGNAIQTIAQIGYTDPEPETLKKQHAQQPRKMRITAILVAGQATLDVMTAKSINNESVTIGNEDSNLYSC